MIVVGAALTGWIWTADVNMPISSSVNIIPETVFFKASFRPIYLGLSKKYLLWKDVLWLLAGRRLFPCAGVAPLRRANLFLLVIVFWKFPSFSVCRVLANLKQLHHFWYVYASLVTPLLIVKYLGQNQSCLFQQVFARASPISCPSQKSTTVSGTPLLIIMEPKPY